MVHPQAYHDHTSYEVQLPLGLQQLQVSQHVYVAIGMTHVHILVLLVFVEDGNEVFQVLWRVGDKDLILDDRSKVKSNS